MLLITSLLGIFLSVILLYYNARNYKSSIYIGVFFLLVSIYGFNQYVVFNSGSVTLVSILLVNEGIMPCLIGPILYLYVRSVLSDDHRLHKKDLLHLLPVIIFLAIALPHMFSPWENKEQIAQKFIESLESTGDFSSAFIGNKFLEAVIFIIPSVVYLGYILWSCRILISYLNHKKIQQVFIGQQSSIQWIKAFLGIDVLLVTGYVAMMIKIVGFENQNGFATYNTFQSILGVGPVAIIILTFFSPGILYGLPRIPDKPAEEKNQENQVYPFPTEVKAGVYRFEADYVENLGLKVETCMMEFHPYLQPDFNLAHFSVLTKIPVHHLSYYFREIKKMSFTDYRNEWRIKHAKVLIKEGKANELTLEAIGLLSGFSTRNTFFTAFKKAEGISPGAFADQFIA